MPNQEWAPLTNDPPNLAPVGAVAPVELVAQGRGWGWRRHYWRDRWGYWHGGRCLPRVGFSNINAKAEGIEGKPAFREAFQRRRCLVPVDNFYEWKKTATGKQPYAIALADRRLMALAGLWETWRSPAGEGIRSFAIITATPNELCAELHNRLPASLPRARAALTKCKPSRGPVWHAALGPAPRTCNCRVWSCHTNGHRGSDRPCWRY
jgi:putative SOS response-associated peptidase YedK